MYSPKSPNGGPCKLRRQDGILLVRVPAVQTHECHEIEERLRVPDPFLEVWILAICTTDLVSEYGAQLHKDRVINKFAVLHKLVELQECCSGVSAFETLPYSKDKRVFQLRLDIARLSAGERIWCVLLTLQVNLVLFLQRECGLLLLLLRSPFSTNT